MIFLCRKVFEPAKEMKVDVGFLDCWHFLTSPQGGVSPRQRRQKCVFTFLSVITRNRGVKPIPSNCTKDCHSHGIVYTIIDGIRKRIDISLYYFTRRVRVSLIIFSQRMAVAKVLCLTLIMTLLHIQHPRKKERKN